MARFAKVAFAVMCVLAVLMGAVSTRELGPTVVVGAPMVVLMIAN